MKDLEKAKQLIRDYYRREFGEDTVPDFSKLTSVGLAYTTSEDEEHELQVSVNLLAASPYILSVVDGVPVDVIVYDSLEELNEDLAFISFDELIWGIDYDNIVPICDYTPVQELIRDAKRQIVEEQKKAIEKQFDREVEK